MSDDKKKAVLARLQRYCAREDRSVQKIKEKLYDIEELTAAQKEEIINQLIEEKFLDEKRFVETYIRSKVNQNKWGRQKIKQGLIRHHIPSPLIDEGLLELNKKVYLNNLSILLAAKQKKSEDRVAWIRYLLQKGYLYEEITQVIDD